MLTGFHVAHEITAMLPYFLDQLVADGCRRAGTSKLRRSRDKHAKLTLRCLMADVATHALDGRVAVVKV